MIHRLTLTSVGFAVAVVSTSMAAEPTFLRRSHSDIREAAIDLSTDSAHYKPMFGVGDGNSAHCQECCPFWRIDSGPGRGAASPSVTRARNRSFTFWKAMASCITATRERP